jgi:RimJ/RimL family protein N-acetyltransferase
MDLFLSTKRLLLRSLSLTDLQDFLAYQTHPANLEYQAIEPFTEEKALHYLEKQSRSLPDEEAGWRAFAVQLQGEERVIGEVGIFLPAQPRSKGDIGWSLHPDYHGQGYATEAAQALLSYAFQVLKLHRVTAGCDTRNTASVRLMERLGMRREAHYLQSVFQNNAWRDEYAYALLRDEWLAQHTDKAE